nr:uncharacterized protein LOC121122110 [Lepeophtheirus salmonis]
MERVAKHYRLDVEQFQSDHAIFQQFKADIDTEDMLLSQIAAELISSEVFHLMPDLYKVIVKRASMPISSCEAKESFSCLRRLKNHHGAGEALLPQPLEHGQSDVGEGAP